APAETLIQEISKNLDDDKIIFFDKKSENKRKLFLRNEFVENFRYIQRTIVSIDKKLVSFLDEDNKHKREISKHAIQNYRNREKYEKLLVDSASELNDIWKKMDDLFSQNVPVDTLSNILKNKLEGAKTHLNEEIKNFEKTIEESLLECQNYIKTFLI